TVGDLAGNRARILERLVRAKAWQADLVVFPELAVTGYPPEDLLLKPRFVEDNLAALRQLVPASRGVTAVIGFVGRAPGGRLANAAAVLADGRHVATYHKQCLPNYGVFDEPRYFAPGRGPVVLDLGGARIGLTICEDLWQEEPIRRLAQEGCSLIVNMSASPYHAGKSLVRQQLFARRARQARAAIAYCNLVGGQDELVFDGSSLILDAGGRRIANGWHCREDLVLADVAGGAARRRPPLPPTRRPLGGPEEEIYEALVLGLGDYVRKNGFETVVLGLSGGIDSGLTACLAVDALGAGHVVGVVMPSRFSSRQTQEDARRLAQALGIRCEELSVEPCFAAYLETLKAPFGDRPADVAEQNIQARIRGNLLMALSNKFGWLVLTTGNKSEMATGYCTLYGDMAGGFAVIKDVPKTLVYQLARWRNRQGGPIPASVFRRAPTAELAPNQRDTDSLPPYEVLDSILKAYVEEDRSFQDIIRRNRVERKTVQRVIRMVDRTEYKRRQGPPGIKITPKAFGKDRRMPITNRYQQS
ncbi:MAG: NAD+ synthase, partial [Candidatus Omnitrophica bacterium]|nr:NAD+ synthase [Candidatus Omnitrophota bacterium]